MKIKPQIKLSLMDVERKRKRTLSRNFLSALIYEKTESWIVSIT